MPHHRETSPTVRTRHPAIAMALALAIAMSSGLFVTRSQAEGEAAQPPPKVTEYLKLQSDPEVEKWIDGQKTGQVQAAPAVDAPQVDIGFAAAFDKARQHIAALAGAIPGIPRELMRVATTIWSEVHAYGAVRLVLLFAAFLAAGWGAQWIFWRLSASVRAWIAGARLDTVADRLAVMAARLAYSAASPLAFGLGSIGAFLAFEWPPLVGQIMLGYLLAVVAYRLARVMLEFLLSPAGMPDLGDSARFRVLPVSDGAAAFWVGRLAYGIGWLAFGVVTVNLLEALGSSLPLRQLAAYALGTVLLVLGIQS
ncbi:MAG: mechanosensitive ion channel family protein, partial [Hyphomicrobiales bacterium]|nr:mechanosensitive ion channel family protein [Hyphomicrobiales bacterium]